MQPSDVAKRGCSGLGICLSHLAPCSYDPSLGASVCTGGRGREGLPRRVRALCGGGAGGLGRSAQHEANRPEWAAAVEQHHRGAVRRGGDTAVLR